MPVDVTVSDGLYQKLDEKKLANALKKAVTETTIELNNECIEYAPVDTGNLKRSHSYEVNGGQAVTRAMVKNSTNYWPYVEYGTRYAPAQGYIQRAVEVTEPGAKITARFGQYYKPGGK
jgi:HK97 gp10 family phage protein